MEISLIGAGSSQAKLAQTKTTQLVLFRDFLGFCNSNVINKSNICFRKNASVAYRKSSNRISLKAAAAAQPEGAVVTEILSSTSGGRSSSKPIDGVKLYVGLPLDSVSDCNAVNHTRAIAAGLKALKLLGVDGVELPVWWGVVEKDAMGKYQWSGYLALAEMVKKVGLKLHVSFCFHASKEPIIPLPQWVSRIGESDPSVFFTDRSGRQFKECLSLSVDDLPVLNGKTPVQVYKEFCESFKASFASFMGSTITGISVGLGPDGELRYPSHQQLTNNTTGAGEFQCYDKNMLAHLKQHAETLGNPLWGLSGPHDAPCYTESPISNNLLKENGGSWETAYGDFFLSWYSSQLLSHGDRLLSLAASTFGDTPVTVSGKVPLLHSWYRTRSHPSELTAGFYNTTKRDGYEGVAEVFAKNSSKIILPGMDLADEHQPNQSLSSPELLLAQITAACRKHGLEISGQNLLVSGAPKDFEQIKKNILGENAVVDLFTYQRMGASFFSPKHFPSFTAFVRSLDQPEFQSDDLPMNGAEDGAPLDSKSRQMRSVYREI